MRYRPSPLLTEPVAGLEGFCYAKNWADVNDLAQEISSEGRQWTTYICCPF